MKSHTGSRDTFAVELLRKGIPMEEVSKLLGHGYDQDHREALRKVGTGTPRPT